MLMKLNKSKLMQIIFQKRLTIAELARLAGISNNAVKRAVQGNKVQLPVIAGICNALNLEPKELIID